MNNARIYQSKICVRIALYTILVKLRKGERVVARISPIISSPKPWTLIWKQFWASKRFDGGDKGASANYVLKKSGTVKGTTRSRKVCYPVFAPRVARVNGGSDAERQEEREQLQVLSEELHVDALWVQYGANELALHRLKTWAMIDFEQKSPTIKEACRELSALCFYSPYARSKAEPENVLFNLLRRTEIPFHKVEIENYEK